MNCKRLFGWRREEGLEAEGKRSALEIGTATHKALAVLDGGGTLDEALSAGRTYLVESAGPTASFMDKELGETIEILDRLIPAYVEFWGGQNELWRPLGQEISFCVEVGEGTQNFLRGKADNLSTYKDGLYLVDKKTAGKMDPRDLLKYELDVQVTAYIYGLSKHLSVEAIGRGEPPIFIRGLIVDVLVKTKIPQFAREFFTRTAEELEDFERQFGEYCNELRQREDRVTAGEDWKTVFPMNTDHCFKWGVCPMRDLCLKDTPVRRKMYVRRPDDYVDEAQHALTALWLSEQEVLTK